MTVERRKNKRGKVDRGGKEDEKEQLTKLQKSVVSWLRKNVPTKKTKFEHSHVVEYFSAGKALDALMTSSPWAPEKAKVMISCILLRLQELINNDRRGLS